MEFNSGFKGLKVNLEFIRTCFQNFFFYFKISLFILYDGQTFSANKQTFSANKQTFSANKQTNTAHKLDKF